MSYYSPQPSGWKPSANKNKKKKPDNGKSNTPSQSLSGGYGGNNSGWRPSAKPKGGRPKGEKPRSFKNAEGFVGHPYGSNNPSVGGGSKSSGGSKSGTKQPIKNNWPTRAWEDRKQYQAGAQRRAYRTRQGLFKGKYYGPDVFKGSESLNAAWEKSGKKGSPSEFMRKRSKGKYGRGPNTGTPR